MSCGVPTADTVWRKRIGSDAQLASFFAEMWHTRSSTRSNHNTFLMASHGFLSEAFAIPCRDLLKIFFEHLFVAMLRKDGPWLCIPIYIWLDLLTISTLVNTKQRDYCNIFSRISTVGILTPLGQGCHFCCWTLLAACLPSSCPAIAPWGCQFVANFAADLIGSWSLYVAVTNHDKPRCKLGQCYVRHKTRLESCWTGWPSRSPLAGCITNEKKNENIWLRSMIYRYL